MHSADPHFEEVLAHDKVPHRSPIPARAYICDDVFSLEQDRLFRSLWIFAGMKQLLREENAFLTRQIGGVSILIQRSGGRLRAFENRCVHRQMALQTETMGCRPIVCRYHGWAYDSNGRVKGIPNSQIYEFPQGFRQALRLREFALREVGNLLFVCTDPDPPPFESQFKREFVETLDESSSMFDWEVAYATFDVDYNWKLNFENVIDWNHVQFIHSKTFYPLLNANAARMETPALSSNLRKVQEGLDEAPAIELHDLSYATHGPLEVPQTPWLKDVGRYGSLDDYYNWFIYPNVNFCSVQGKMFLLQQYMPKTPNRTEYHLWVVTARRQKTHAEFAGLLWALLKDEKAVIDEDAAVLEALQSKLAADEITCTNGAYEAHIVRMHRWYAQRLGLESRT